MAERVPRWLGKILIPQISKMKGELKAMNAKMDGEFRVVHSEIKRVEETMSTKISELDRRMDVTRRLAAVEEQLKELRAKA